MIREQLQIETIVKFIERQLSQWGQTELRTAERLRGKDTESEEGQIKHGTEVLKKFQQRNQ